MAVSSSAAASAAAIAASWSYVDAGALGLVPIDSSSARCRALSSRSAALDGSAMAAIAASSRSSSTLTDDAPTDAPTGLSPPRCSGAVSNANAEGTGGGSGDAAIRCAHSTGHTFCLCSSMARRMTSFLHASQAIVRVPHASLWDVYVERATFNVQYSHGMSVFGHVSN